MRDGLAKYVVVIHVALLAVLLSWVHGGTRAEYLTALPWLSLAVLELLCFLPPVRRDETLEMARQRTWSKLAWDPLLYIGLALCVYLMFQGLNGGRRLVFDAENNAWSFSLPPVGWGPFCVDPVQARQMLYWWIPACAAALGIRHGMNRRGKLMLLRVLAINGALLSFLGIVQHLSGTHKLLWMTPLDAPFFASFSYAGHAGAFFTLLYVINGGLFLQALLAEEERLHAVWLGGALVLNLLGALLSLSQTAILCSLALTLILGVYALRHAWHLITAGVRLKALSIFVTSILMGSAFLFFALPDNPVLNQIQTVTWAKIRGSDDAGLRVTTAWDIWKDYPWFGVGGGGYRHYVGLYLNEVQRARLHEGVSNVNCDPMQFLVEHGAVGFGLMLGAVAVLLFPIMRRLRLAQRPRVVGWSSERWLLFRISPITVTVLAGTTVVVLFSLIDQPFRSPAVLVLWTIALTCAPAFLPARYPAVAPVRDKGRQDDGRRPLTQPEHAAVGVSAGTP